MIIERVQIRGFGPIQAFDQRFRHENCIVGPNGGGKTTLLGVIAGVAGTDSATDLVTGGHALFDGKIDYCSVTVREGSESFRFETRGSFDRDQVTEFKEKLPKRVNFGLTEWRKTFPSHCVDGATARRFFNQYCNAHHSQHGGGPKPQDDFFYHPQSRRAGFHAGDGYQFAMFLFLNDSSEGVPALYDNPSRHMDLYGKRIMTEMLCREERQLFYTTHCPEMVLHDGWKGTNKAQLVLDIPQRAPKKQTIGS